MKIVRLCLAMIQRPEPIGNVVQEVAGACNGIFPVPPHGYLSSHLKSLRHP